MSEPILKTLVGACGLGGHTRELWLCSDDHLWAVEGATEENPVLLRDFGSVHAYVDESGNPRQDSELPRREGWQSVGMPVSAEMEVLSWEDPEGFRREVEKQLDLKWKEEPPN